ncbi:MAG: CHC2 zinc finger domain-containing protein [Candidatus Omnitrophica bacterium]|nr:CHC2 zinc finger domain-containing protein [Candidatus Omnitrophota bacterium]
MVNDYYDMMHQTREKVKQHAEENGYPAPSSTLTPIFVSLVTRHKLSIIMGEIDKMIARLFVLNDALDNAIEENNLVAVVLIKTRLDEEKAKLRSYERLLDKEGPVKKEPENGITDEMIQRAKDSPIEELLPEELKRGRCRCPVHGGKNPMSFEVKNNRGRCHSCHWEGDTIQLLIDTRSMSFVQAVRYLQ